MGTTYFIAARESNAFDQLGKDKPVKAKKTQQRKLVQPPPKRTPPPKQTPPPRWGATPTKPATRQDPTKPATRQDPTKPASQPNGGLQPYTPIRNSPPIINPVGREPGQTPPIFNYPSYDQAVKANQQGYLRDGIFSVLSQGIKAFGRNPSTQIATPTTTALSSNNGNDANDTVQFQQSQQGARPQNGDSVGGQAGTAIDTLTDFASKNFLWLAGAGLGIYLLTKESPIKGK
jgi:hypothetical protein